MSDSKFIQLEEIRSFLASGRDVFVRHNYYSLDKCYVVYLDNEEIGCVNLHDLLEFYDFISIGSGGSYDDFSLCLIKEEK